MQPIWTPRRSRASSRERLGRRFEEEVVEHLPVSKATGLSSSGRVKTTWKYAMGRSSRSRASIHFSFFRNWHLGQCLFLHELYDIFTWPHASHSSTCPPSSAVLQISMARMVLQLL